MPTASVCRGPVAFLSHTLPPAGGGQAVALGRLLGGIDPAAYRLVTSDRRPMVTSDADRPAGRVPPPWFLRRLRRVGRLQPAVFAAMVAWRARSVARLLERERCSAIVGCSGGDLVDIPAAVAASRLARIPAFLYYFDDYRHQWQAQGLPWHARTTNRLRDAVEAEALAGAAGIIVPNECLAEDVRSRIAAPVAIVRNPVDTADYATRRGRHAHPHAARRVVYTGAVYEAQGAALRTAAVAIDVLRAAGRDVALHLYTPDAPTRLQAQGIPGSVVVHPAVTQAEAAEIQMAADVLLLPLSMTSSYPDLIRTSAPGKLGEYLAAGRPLLVHGPADSFPVRFAARHECAAICDIDDAGRLADVLARVLDDGAWAASLARRAVAASDSFALAANRAVLHKFIGLESASRSADNTA